MHGRSRLPDLTSERKRLVLQRFLILARDEHRHEIVLAAKRVTAGPHPGQLLHDSIYSIVDGLPFGRR
ncbi:hypothetical protein D3C84_868950 [compost metagenome]